MQQTDMVNKYGLQQATEFALHYYIFTFLWNSAEYNKMTSDVITADLTVINLWRTFADRLLELAVTS